MHPRDGRPVFAYPWEGVTLVGTTDVDHGASLDLEPAITRGELDYLLAALHWQFPQLALGEDDVLATFAGVRPVIDSGQLDPSKEAREHALWLENGLLTVAGGKLTTFRVIALDALRRAAPLLPGWQADLRPLPIFDATPALSGKALLLDGEQRARLVGQHGAARAGAVRGGARGRTGAGARHADPVGAAALGRARGSRAAPGRPAAAAHAPRFAAGRRRACYHAAPARHLPA